MARRRGAVVVYSSLAVLAMVYTLLLQGSAYVSASAEMASRILKPTEGLVLTGECGGGCVAAACEALLEARGGQASVILVAPLNSGAEGLPLPKGLPERGVSVGYLLAESLGLRRGDNITLIVGGSRLEYTVESIHRTGSALDSQVVAPGPVPGCTALWYASGAHDPSRLAAAVGGQVRGALTAWYTLSLAALALASVAASIKVYSDLSGEAESLRDQGVGLERLILAVSLLPAASVLVGYAWGVVASHVIGSLTAALTGAYIPPPIPGPGDLAFQALLPAALASLAALAAGYRLWLRAPRG